MSLQRVQRVGLLTIANGMKSGNVVARVLPV